MSGDQNWLYISAYEQNLVYVYRKSNPVAYSAGTFTVGKTYTITSLGTTTQSEWNIIAGTNANKRCPFVSPENWTAIISYTTQANIAAAIIIHWPSWILHVSLGS
jgi:hypothetical protein